MPRVGGTNSSMRPSGCLKYGRTEARAPSGNGSIDLQISPGENVKLLPVGSLNGAGASDRGIGKLMRVAGGLELLTTAVFELRSKEKRAFYRGLALA